MLTFLKGLNMMERKETCEHCTCCECCQCKKIFMFLVLMILTFIAGIMVGNCRSSYFNQDTLLQYQAMQRKHHRGMHPISPKSEHHATVTKNTDSSVGGYIVEIGD